MKSFRLLLLFLFISQVINAQILEPVKWKIESQQIEGDEYELVFTASIDDGWNVYSQFTSDDGPVPTSITYEQSEGVELIGEATEEGNKKEGFDKLFEVNVIKFLDDEDFIIRQRLKVVDNSKPLTGYLTFMTCNDVRCLQPTDVEFDINFNEGGATDEAIPSEPASIDQDLEEIEEPKIEKPVTWEVSINDLGDSKKELVYKATMEPSWTVYSQFTSDDGPVPTSINYDDESSFKRLGESTEHGHRKEGMDKLFDVNVIKFLDDEPFEIKQQIEIIDDSKLIKGYLTFMTCDDSKCLMPTDIDFEFDPKANTARIVDLMAPIASEGANIDGNQITQLIPTIVESYKSPEADCGGEEQVSDADYLGIFVGGFIGGLLAILLPCIFPMIPITVSFFTKDTKRSGLMNGLIYGLSIIIIFVSIGLAVTAIFGPEALNQLSTSWIANTIFFLIFVAFAISFFGYFEITLPSSWSTKSDAMADKGGLLGIFFMAATLAIVSFSCTGPIIGTALVQVASSGSYLGPFMIMFGFSLALALPFGLFAAFPAWLNSLPKSGSWMTSVKVVLGFLELALALKFLSVADMTSHWNFLRYELFMGLWILIFIAMGVYLFGYIRFAHDSKLKKLSFTRMTCGILAFVFAGYLATGFFYNEEIQTYNSPGLTSGLAPPATYNYFLTPPELDKEIKEKYPSYTLCANNIPCFKDYYEGLAYAKEVNRPLFVDFTGYGCVNCRKTEEHIWVDKEIRKKLINEHVLISLYVDDRKKLDEQLVSAVTGAKIRNVGNKWADFQIVNFASNAQPLYVPINLDQEVMSAPRGYQEGISNYRDFLDCSLAAFNAQN